MRAAASSRPAGSVAVDDLEQRAVEPAVGAQPVDVLDPFLGQGAHRGVGVDLGQQAGGAVGGVERDVGVVPQLEDLGRAARRAVRRGRP